MKKVWISLISLLIIALGVLLYFVINKKTYTVTFDSNGGTVVQSQTVKSGDKAKEPVEPTKEDYSFAGWYQEGKKYDFSSPVKANIKLTARWVPIEVEPDPEPEPEPTEDDTCTLTCPAGEKLENPDSKNCKCVKDSTETTDKVVKVTSIKLGRTSLSLEKGKKASVSLTIKPDNATNKTAVWKSSNTKVATVSDGVVTAVGVGTATITVTVDGKSTKLTVTVTNSTSGGSSSGGNSGNNEPDTPTTISVNSVSLSKSSLNLTVGEFENLTATVLPSNATNKNVTWSSSNTSIATVDNGKVTAVSVGNATITVTTVDGSKKATATVTVSPVPVTTYSVTFNSNGGTGVPNQTVNMNSAPTLPTAPTRTGYNFVRWEINGVVYNFDTALNANTTIDAVWEGKGYTYLGVTCPAVIGQGQACFEIYYNGTKVTSGAGMFLANASNSWLGDFNTSSGLVIMNESKVNQISKIYTGTAYLSISLNS